MMAVLSKPELRWAIMRREFHIDFGKPELNEEAINLGFDECSVNLSLDAKIWVPKQARGITVALQDSDIQECLKTAYEEIDISKTGYVLKPKSFIIAQTREYIENGQHLARRIEGSSRYARLGLLIHATAPTIQPGFGDSEKASPITLELANVGEITIVLHERDELCQLIIETVEGRISDPSTGIFDSQSSATG